MLREKFLKNDILKVTPKVNFNLKNITTVLINIFTLPMVNANIVNVLSSMQRKIWLMMLIKKDG